MAARLRVPREDDFRSRLRDERVSARIGLWLGLAFAVCFASGLLSHGAQHPPAWFSWPTRPVGLYRVTQGLHVLTGIAAIPLLLAKLYSVYPRLFVWPPVRSPVHALERLSVLVLMGAAFFQLVTGVLNVAQWYAFGFPFPSTHFAVAWVAVGAIVVHVGVKLPVIRRALGTPLEVEPVADGRPPGVPRAGVVSRRTFLSGTGLAAGAAVVATAGMAVPWLRDVSVLAVRSGDGPQGLPVNTSAAAAGVTPRATGPAYRLGLSGPDGERRLTLEDLRAMRQHRVTLPISCVEGWSASGDWSGLRVADLVRLVGGSPEADVRFTSLERGGAWSQSVLPAAHARDPLTLLALRLNGEVLHPDHGFPCRLIAPSRPGVLQTKWVHRVEVLKA
ncbi:MAG: molybdopterin-dependent oxidoreductase [Actinomycetes bacterium]